MRPVAQPRSITRQVRRATQPATPPSDLRTTGPQGTPGGKAMPTRKPGSARQPLKIGQEKYLWILVAIEITLVGGLRKFFRRVHGG